MKLSNKFELTLTSSLLAAFSLGTPWLWLNGLAEVAVFIGAGCTCASALAFTTFHSEFGR